MPHTTSWEGLIRLELSDNYSCKRPGSGHMTTHQSSWLLRQAVFPSFHCVIRSHVLEITCSLKGHLSKLEILGGPLPYFQPSLVEAKPCKTILLPVLPRPTPFLHLSSSSTSFSSPNSFSRCWRSLLRPQLRPRGWDVAGRGPLRVPWRIHFRARHQQPWLCPKQRDGTECSRPVQALPAQNDKERNHEQVSSILQEG